MTHILSVLAAIVLCAVLMPMAVRSMRRRRRGGGLGDGLMSLEAAYRPSVRHVIEAGQEQTKGSEESSEPPTGSHEPREPGDR